MIKECRHCGQAIRLRPEAWPLPAASTERLFEWFHVETGRRDCVGVRVPVAEPAEDEEKA